ncbi:nuclease (SNase domain-containing protein) [Caldalkalibacillus thermarum TA2.A1]|uniref:Nuclease (SNase domain-containing protein) n=1 Tax=Caldalkalibacillus thermarum (strain TA2.A1) TaxID=986075 RepID=F5L3S7_CALTT|nr:thermonuclease family protein [Caldalkalibacillus thermarum]EGL84000.1 nuclease (SNase domain-containing protein) [Caldalkalibacillus thermarum TA2.A1]
MIKKLLKPRACLLWSLFILISVMLVGCAEETTNLPEETDQIDADMGEAIDQNLDQVENEDFEAEEKQEFSRKETDKDTHEEAGKGDMPASTLPAHVVRVVDGDTFVANINGKEEKVLLILVDTPETVHPSKPAEPFGPEASEFAKQMLEGKEIHLELDVSERDRYGRVLAYVWIGDRMFNEILLEKGLARVVVFPPDVKYVDRFREIEKEAQQKGIGIWSIEDYARQENSNSSSATNNTASNPVAIVTNPKLRVTLTQKVKKYTMFLVDSFMM